MTPADELRAAATKLRTDAEAAQKASPGPWSVTDEHVIRCADRLIVVDRSDTDHPAERADLPYIAAMHPPVGAALAQLLNAIATHLDANTHPDWQESVAGLPLAVARAINGTTP